MARARAAGGSPRSYVKLYLGPAALPLFVPSMCLVSGRHVPPLGEQQGRAVLRPSALVSGQPGHSAARRRPRSVGESEGIFLSAQRVASASCSSPLALRALGELTTLLVRCVPAAAAVVN